MAETLEKVNLGMAEFIAKLIDETMEAVIDAQNTQAEQNAAIRSSALMSIEEFAQSHISDDIALTYLKEKINPNALPVVGRAFDINYYKQLFNVEFQADEVTISKKSTILLKPGYERLLLLCKIELSEEKHQIFKQLLKDGLPKIVIDNGEITAKVAFTAVTNSQTTAETKNLKSKTLDSSTITKSPSISLDSKILDGSTTLIKANTFDKVSPSYTDKYLPETKIILENATQSSSNSTTSLFGEVTLRFKTVY